MKQNNDAIVSAAIYPSIGIARVGNSPDEYFIGPLVPDEASKPEGFYKDAEGRLKRQVAEFRIFGLNAKGEVVKELNAENADITWNVHVANKKAAWFEFTQALDIKTTPPAKLRNANFVGDDRKKLEIDPGARSITGKSKSGNAYQFDTGEFVGERVYLGELRTDDSGRLLFFGGHGLSKSAFPDNPPTTFADNNGWHDDTSDGPVTAEVILDDIKLDVKPAWVIVAPPNYAPDVISVQTIHDVIFDACNGAFSAQKTIPSFTHDILPLLQQFSWAQWVNFGFYVGYGHNQAYDFNNKELIARLSKKGTEFREYRRQIFNYFRDPSSDQIDAEAWPWMYGDQVTIPAQSAQAYMSVTNTLYGYLKNWVDGNFIDDYNPDAQPPKMIDEIDNPAEQAAAMEKASLWYCLGGAFHPGCEMTWPVRHQTMYSEPFRIRHRAANDPTPDYGNVLSYEKVMASNGPLYGQSPGDITRWMAVPWQTDTASCRSGYDSAYDPWLPTFWPARVPNHVLTEKEYEKVMDESLSMEERVKAFNKRASWYRILGEGYLNQVNNMITLFGDLGVVERREGIPDSKEFPPVMYVETEPYAGGAPTSEELMAVKTRKGDYEKTNYVGVVDKVRPKA